MPYKYPSARQRQLDSTEEGGRPRSQDRAATPVSSPAPAPGGSSTQRLRRAAPADPKAAKVKKMRAKRIRRASERHDKAVIEGTDRPDTPSKPKSGR